MAYRYDEDSFQEWCEENDGVFRSAIVYDENGDAVYGREEDVEELKAVSKCEFEGTGVEFRLESDVVDPDEEARMTGKEKDFPVKKSGHPANLDNFVASKFKKLEDGEVVDENEEPGGIYNSTWVSTSPVSREKKRREINWSHSDGFQKFYAPNVDTEDYNCTFTVSVYGGEHEVDSIEEAERLAEEEAEDRRQEAADAGVTAQKGDMMSQAYKAEGHYFLQDLHLEDVECESA